MATRWHSLLLIVALSLFALANGQSNSTNSSTSTNSTNVSTDTSSTSIPAGTNCALTRMRKSWDDYNTSEKNLYIAAVTKAIALGYQQKFVELHTEYFSELEAHQTCVFIYWHRMFLLGYENMLRSLASEYACLTLPVWDHLTLSGLYSTKKCTGLQSCSPIMKDLGGYSTGYYKNSVVYNVTIPYSTSRTYGQLCINQGPLYQYCFNATSCGHCVMRGNVNNVYPTAALYTSVYTQMFSSNNSASFTQLVERGVHNTVHSAISGTMAYFQSPLDPIFFAHHSFIDALQTVYLKCQNRAEGVLLTDAQKSSDTRFWSSCSRRNKGVFNANDTITMKVLANDNKTWANVRTEPNSKLYPFFKDLPGRFQDYVDAKDIPLYNYTYQLSGGLAKMYTYCWQSNSINSATTTLLANEESAKKSPHPIPRPELEPSTDIDIKMQHWSIAIFEAAKIVGYTEDAARQQMELVMCQHKEECLGGTADYSDLFRTNFMVEGHPRCYTLVQDLKSGDRVIGVPNWRNITSHFLPCPSRKRSSFQSIQ